MRFSSRISLPAFNLVNCEHPAHRVDSALVEKRRWQPLSKPHASRRAGLVAGYTPQASLRLVAAGQLPVDLRPKFDGQVPQGLITQADGHSSEG